MGQGYQAAPGDSIKPITDRILRVETAVRDLQRPGGTSVASLYDQVQQALANINATVSAAISANSYTKAQIDSKIASPGDIAPHDVTASGRVYSTGVLQSPGSFAYQVTTGYVSAWINNDGRIGFSPSNRDSKTDLEEMSDAGAILDVVPYWGRYKTDDPDSPLKVFVIAEDVVAAGFGPDVAPVNEDGIPFTVNYSQLVVPLLAAVRSMRAELDDLRAKLQPTEGEADDAS